MENEQTDRRDSGLEADRNDLLASKGLRRDEFIRRAVGGGVAIAAGGLLGPGEALASLGRDAHVAKRKRGGTLTHGGQAGSPWPTLDAHTTFGWAPDARISQLYEPLLEFDKTQLKYLPILAEEFTLEKADQYLIRVRPGITFTNGKPLTADDVIYTFRRLINKKLGTLLGSSLTSVDPNGFKKLDKYTVRMKLRRGDVTIKDAMTAWCSGVVPVGYNPKKPIGTGPFILKSYTPGRTSTMVRNPNYWQSGKPYLDTLIVLDFQDDSARANALLGGQVQSIDHVPYPFYPTIQNRKDLRILAAHPTGLHVDYTMRLDTPPFDNNDVRLAMKLIIDREACLKQGIAGHGILGNDMIGYLDPSYNHSIPQRTQDLEQAKFLLNRAGQSSLKVDLNAGQPLTGAVEMAQVFAANAAQIGVTINVKKIDTSVLYGPNYLKWPFADDFWGSHKYLYQTGLQNLKGAVENETGWPPASLSAKWTSLYHQAIGTIDFAKRTELIHEMQKLEFDQSGNIIPVFIDVIDAYSTKIVGVSHPADKGDLPFNRYSFKDLSFA